MTIEEQYAAIGRAHAELRQKKEQLQALLLIADNLGQTFQRLGQVLRENPQYAGLNGESSMTLDIVPPDQGQLFSRKTFDANDFCGLTHQIRQTMRDIANLERKLA